MLSDWGEEAELVQPRLPLNMIFFALLPPEHQEPYQMLPEARRELERGQFERDESSMESRVQWKPDSTLKGGFVDQQAV